MENAELGNPVSAIGEIPLLRRQPGGSFPVLNRRPETSPSALARFLPTPTTPFVHEASKFRVLSTFRVTACCEGTPDRHKRRLHRGRLLADAIGTCEGELPCAQLATPVACSQALILLELMTFWLHQPEMEELAISMSTSMGNKRVKDRFVHSWTCLGIHLTRLRGREAPLALGHRLRVLVCGVGTRETTTANRRRGRRGTGEPSL